MSAVSTDVSSSKAEITRHKLIEAGIQLFAEHGYEATSTRQVQVAAAVQRNLITYHFGSKEAFWKSCMTVLFERFTEQLEPVIAQSSDIEAQERMRFLIRRFVRASAEHPEINRIMFDEGRGDNWRLDWLVEHFVRPFYDTVTTLFDQGGLQASGLSPIQVYYFLVSSASVFAMAPEYRRLSGEDPFDESLVDAQANAMADLLTTTLLREDSAIATG